MDDLLGFCIQISKHKAPPVTCLYLLNSDYETMNLYDMTSDLKKFLNDLSSLTSYIERLPHAIKTTSNLILYKTCPACIYLQDQDFPSIEISLFPYKESSIASLHAILSSKCQVLEVSSENQDTTDSHEDLVSILLDNGNLYVGKINDKGLPHSNDGKEFCTDGTMIYGSYRNGLRHGPAQIFDEKLECHSVEYIKGVICGI